MARINKALLRRAIEARFATMFYGAIRADGRLSYCNAGQEPPLVVARATARAGSKTGGPVLGPAQHRHLRVRDRARSQPGDLVVVCSDGVTEARNAAGDEFGRDRLIEALHGCHGVKPDVVLEHVLGSGADVLAGRGAGRRHHRCSIAALQGERRAEPGRGTWLRRIP